MDRRSLLKLIATTAGANIALPQSVFARLGDPLDPKDLDFFRPAQRAQLAALSEAIIPKTETPGAIDAGVPGWIEILVKDCFDETDQKIITTGLTDLARRCQEQHGKSIDQLPGEQQVAFLTKADNDLKKERRNLPEEQKHRRTSLQMLKDLTKLCYCSSEVGATQAFDYHLVPGKWIPAMPLEPGTKAYAM